MLGLLGSRALVLVLALAAAARADDEIVEEFRRFFGKYKETDVRVEAILTLEDAKTPGVVDVLVPVLDDPDPVVVDACVRVLGGFEAREPVDALLVALAGAKSEPVRVAILRALAGGAYAGTEEAVAECLTDRSWQVRRRAVQALAASGASASDVAILGLCADREVAVRCAALEGLAALGSARVLEPARRALDDDAWQVRASAASALGSVRHRDSIGPLLARMRVEEGRLAQDLANALERLTGRDFGTRLELWERFWESYGDRYQIPSDEELAALREKQKERKEQYRPEVGTAYHGIETPSRSILFVIDVSGSMENHVVEKERFAEGDYPSFSRMDIVKTELSRTVERLEPYVEFNILSFATDLKPWKKRPVAANVLNKDSAVSWCRRLEPIGGASKQDLAQVGLARTANLEGGKTNTYAALMWALGVGQGKSPGEGYEVELDTIFFLSDGDPSTGEFVDIDEILDEVRKANELRRIVLHTIAIGDVRKDFMARLAAENGGTFVDLGS